MLKRGPLSSLSKSKSKGVWFMKAFPSLTHQLKSWEDVWSASAPIHDAWIDLLLQFELLNTVINNRKTPFWNASRIVELPSSQMSRGTPLQISSVGKLICRLPTSYSYKCGVFRLLKRGRVTFHAILTSSMEHQHPEMYQISSVFIKYYIKAINFSLFFETK